MDHHKKSRRGPYPPASDVARAPSGEIDSPQYRSESYKLAFLDTDFLLWDELRPTRMHLELLKPELVLQENGIESTIVVFGSARVPEPSQAEQTVEAARARAAESPDDRSVQRQLRIAENRAANSRYYSEARKLGRLISQQTPEDRMVVITGGGPGIMEAANRGADDVVARSIGLNIVLPHEQAPNSYITPELCFQFHYFATRKMHFLIRARGLVAFPGGFGTLDELFETLTLLQAKKIKPIPVILFSRSYWERVVDFEAMVEEGTISEADLDLFQYVETAEEAWEIIAGFNGIDSHDE